MKIDRLITLLPCSSLEDLRLDRNPQQSEELLSAWSALWHPALIDSAQTVPVWHPADHPPQEPAGSLIILPECCESLLPDDWLSEAEASGVLLLRKLKNRPEMVAAALERLDGRPAPIDPDLADDFLALGFCRFVVELLIRKYRYMSNIDEAALQAAVLAAAKAAAQGDVAAARAELQSAFDRLHEAREYFYPVETRLIDFTPLASTTLGESLRKQFAAGLPCNLLVSAEVLQEMARREPATLAALKQALAKGKVSILGGESTEIPLHMLYPQAIEFHLRGGLEVYQNLLDRRPAIFARRRFGLTPALPQILAKTGFTAAVHFTLDDGQFPTANQSCIQWEGFGGAAIAALARVPLEADRADSFFRLPEKLGHVMEADQPATLVFAHWPSRVSTWYKDLARIASYSPVLGAFCTLDDYFRQAGSSGQKVKFNADQYRSPSLAQDAAATRSDSISLWVRYFRRRAAWQSIETLNALAALVSKSQNQEIAGDLATKLGELAVSLDDSLNPNAPADPELDNRLLQVLDVASRLFLPGIGVGAPPSQTNQTTGDPPTGLVLLNPCSFSRRVGIALLECGTNPETVDPVIAAHGTTAIVDVPGMGFAWIAQGEHEPSTSKSPEKKNAAGKHKSAPPMAEENIIRNEFFEAVIDPQTGGIRAIRDYRSRHPRLAQQIALRIPQPGENDPDSNAQYSQMIAEEVRVTSAGPIMGEIVSSGKITDGQGRRLAGFKQTACAWQANRILELEIQLDIERLPEANPWNSYYACRFAWHDEASTLFRSVNMTTQPTELKRFESPLFVDICCGEFRTTILCGGLPYHRRIGLRRLDTPLVVQGETARRFRLAVGIDLPNAMTAALDFLSTPIAQYPCTPPPAKHGWLFHIDHRNVIATRWEPLLKSPLPLGEGQGEGRVQESHLAPGEHTGDFAQGKDVIGFRVQLLETEGRRAQFSLRSFRAVASAQKIEPGNASPVKLPIDGDKINITISPYQMIDVEAFF